MTRPTAYRPRVPDDLHAEIAALSDGTYKGQHELVMRYIREGIEKDRAVQRVESRAVPGAGIFKGAVTIEMWAERYALNVFEVLGKYVELFDLETANGSDQIFSAEIKALNKAFFGERYARDIALYKLAKGEI